ncbi:MAG: asparagine synthase (glutamine-hydrolyzing) [Elusimicrobiales bacterium]
MCGFCGLVPLDGKARDAAPVKAMRAALAHRGPDDEGELSLPGGALGFRRLSILDIEGGHQPMVSDDGAAAIVFNGEIYNHPALKSELEAKGEKFLTRSDTETILRLYLREGEGAIARLRGMFAFAIADTRRKKLILARDHIGIKPLYYCVRGGALYFSSELRSLLKAGIPADFDPAGLRDYLENNFVRAPRTVISGVFKLPAGHKLVFDLEGGKTPQPERFYALKTSDDGIRDGNEALERLDALLNDSVKAHLLSDVPVGAFLSGGVDSSLLTALMCRHYPGKVKTFSIGFSGARAGMDESRWAKKAALHLGTEHNEIMLPADVLGRIPELLLALDEPLGDSAVLPVFLLSQYAAKQVKVALSGEGADELFAGYNRYKAAYLTYLAAKNPAWRAVMAARGNFSSDAFYRAMPLDSQDKWMEASRHSRPEDAAYFMKAAGGAEFWRDYTERAEGFNGMLLADFRTIMADCLLMKVDKAAMAASLETRVPFLTPELAEFAFNLSPELKSRRFKSKWLLRKLAEKYLPSDIVWRRKHGFWSPWEEWIKSGPPEVFDALSSGALGGDPVFDFKKLEAELSALRSGGKTRDTGLVFRAAVLALWKRALSL